MLKMEFNKSSRFNNDNENTVKQNLIHYAGKAGEFDYDPNIWEISSNNLMFKNKEVVSLPKNLELPKGCINTSCMFCGCKSLTDITSLQNWDTSNIKNMTGMFSNCENLIDITPLQNWDTSNVKKMFAKFKNCKKLTNISALENWNTSNV